MTENNCDLDKTQIIQELIKNPKDKHLIVATVCTIFFLLGAAFSYVIVKGGVPALEEYFKTASDKK